MLCRLPDYAAMNGFRASLHGLQRSLTRHNHRSSPDWQDDRKETDHMTTEDGRPPCLLDGQIEHFLESLRNSGYAEPTVRKKRSVARAFVRWAKRKRIATDDLNDTHVTAFVTRSRRKRKARVKFELAAMRLFFDYLRPAAASQYQTGPEPASAAVGLLLRYEDYLRKERGLAENSLHVYIPFIRDFLAAQTTQAGIAQDAFDTLTIRSFLL